MRRTLGIATLFLRRREGDDDSHTSPVARHHLCPPAELHGEAMNESEAKAASGARSEGSVIGIDASSITNSISFPPLSVASMRTSGVATPEKS